MTLDLQIIAMQLEGLEETIIGKLLDRAQFAVNAPAYTPGQSGFTDGDPRSLFDIRLRYQEEMDAVFGRFCVPEERPFTTSLPAPQRSAAVGDTGLHIDNFDAANICPGIAEAYHALRPSLCRSGDDGNYGSSVEHDVIALQALSRRVHYGALYVAECKYADAPTAYDTLIDAGDTTAIEEKLTRVEVEERIIARVAQKVDTMQARINREIRTYVDPSIITKFYREAVIPLTKNGEVAYLLNRNRT